MAKSKTKKYMCQCDEQFDTIKQMVNHYRAHHPDSGYDLYDRVATVGDRLADPVITYFAKQHNEVLQTLWKAQGELRKLKQEHQSLRVNYDELIRRVQIVQLATAVRFDVVAPSSLPAQSVNQTNDRV